MMSTKSFSEKMHDWLRYILSCCDKDDEEVKRPALQISGPTNFRREDITIPGLDPEQQQFIRTKAIADAQKLYTHLQPLRSSPSGHFAGPTSPRMPTYEEFTTSRSAPSPTTPHRRTSHKSTLERVKRHSRKISNSLSKPLGVGSYGVGGGYLGLGGDFGSPKNDSKYEMRALMDPSGTPSRVVSPMLIEAKSSGESFSIGGSELEDGASGKGMVKL